MLVFILHPMKRSFLILSLCLILSWAEASVRITRSINDSWTFTKEGIKEIVSFPHCWNAHDTWDEVPGYYRGTCTYDKKVRINDNLDGKKVYVRFEGAGQVCELLINGKSVGMHRGGYTAFIFDVTDEVRQGENDFHIILNNSHDVDIPPLSADFTFYGGVYRDVDLVITSKDHICNTYYASSGVFITTPKVGQTSSVHIRTLLSVTEGTYKVSQKVYSPEGVLVASNEKKTKKKDSECVQEFDVENCKLWDICTPAVYRVVTTLYNDKGEELDRVENPLGFRTFSFDVENGFTINGRSVKLMGTNRHQDFLDHGNALSDEMHVRDVTLLKEMGGNFLRIAHYPQDPIVTQLCDRFGLVCSIEIPIVNYVTESQKFKETCIEMAKEMVCQDFNSPSVIIWAYMNEVLLHPPYKEKVRRQQYFETVCEQARAINEAIKELDPARYTMIPCNGNPTRYHEAGLTPIPDILGWNYYNGWYSKTFNDFSNAIQKIHTLVPTKPFILTEYGAGIDPRIHSKAPERFDFSIEFGLMFHRYYIDVIRNTKYIAGSNVWNLNDFYCERRVDAVPHVNNKGLVGLDRVPKDTYRLYQAILLNEPFLCIGGREWKLRGGNEGETRNVEVYTNQNDVTLFHNGVKVGCEKAEKGCAKFTIKPRNGENTLAAKAGELHDAVRFKYFAVPNDLRNFTEMNVSLGTACEFEDDIKGAVWIPEKPYEKGSWGFIGGGHFRLKDSSLGSYPGSKYDILGTINNPIFQTQRVGIESFKADVPDGKYYVYLYFAELAFKTEGKALSYYIGTEGKAIKDTNRTFDVSINGTKVLTNYNISKEEGINRAVIRKFTVDVTNGKGLSVDFSKIEGESVLNAIRIYRCM